MSSGVWWRFEERATKEETSLPQYDHAAIRYWLDYMNAREADWTALLAVLDRPVLTLQYDALVADFAGTIGAICDFARVGRAHAAGGIRSEMKKQSDATTTHWVQRFLADCASEAVTA